MFLFQKGEIEKKKGIRGPTQVQNLKARWGRDLHFGLTGGPTPALMGWSPVPVAREGESHASGSTSLGV